MKDLLIVWFAVMLVVFGLALGLRYQRFDEEPIFEQCLENNLDYSLADREYRCKQAITLFKGDENGR